MKCCAILLCRSDVGVGKRQAAACLSPIPAQKKCVRYTCKYSLAWKLLSGSKANSLLEALQVSHLLLHLGCLEKGVTRLGETNSQHCLLGWGLMWVLLQPSERLEVLWGCAKSSGRFCNKHLVKCKYLSSNVQEQCARLSSNCSGCLPSCLKLKDELKDVPETKALNAVCNQCAHPTVSGQVYEPLV